MAANIDASEALDEMERALAAGKDRQRCDKVLVILRRWQWDADFDGPSRRRAAVLLAKYKHRYGWT